MTRIDFYISPDTAAQARAQLACRITEKAYLQEHRIYLHLADNAQLEMIDTLLWTFRPGSFIPHCRGDDKQAVHSPVLIGFSQPPETSCDVLINLSDDVPAFFSRFTRVAEIISGDEATRHKGRERYKFYRDQGYPLQSHDLSG